MRIGCAFCQLNCVRRTKTESTAMWTWKNEMKRQTSKYTHTHTHDGQVFKSRKLKIIVLWNPSFVLGWSVAWKWRCHCRQIGIPIYKQASECKFTMTILELKTALFLFHSFIHSFELGHHQKVERERKVVEINLSCVSWHSAFGRIIQMELKRF